MYFIPRNNAFYNYIAHTHNRRRYVATFFIVGLMGMFGFYGMYKPLTAHIMLYKTELARLEKQLEQSQQLGKGNNDLLVLVNMHKKNINIHAIEDNKREESCNKRTQCIFDLVVKVGLVLYSYGPCTEKDKKWYIKDSAAYQVIGSFQNIVLFLKSIKNLNELITISSLVLTHTKDNLFQLNCDIGLISIKK